MAHVQIQVGGGRDARLLVDGVDITHDVLADGLSVDVRAGVNGPSLVHLTLVANVLDLDIDDAEFDAKMTERRRVLCEGSDD